MGFKNDARFVKVWEIKDEGNYHTVSLSTSKKNKQTDVYEKDFSSKFVRFIGKAHSLAKDLKSGDVIKILLCEVQNSYNEETKKETVKYLVFDFEKENGNTATTTKAKTTTISEVVNVPEDADEDLPFC
jgi:hypothetical protein